MSTTQDLVNRARTVMPAGVNSPVRAFGSVGGTPPMIQRADGPFLYDTEGKEYVDLVCSWGPALLGHAEPRVLEAVHAAVDRGLSFGASTPSEAELAELIISRVPGLEKLRLVSTGTEATMTAVRLARGVTGRDLIIKFAGCYHGHVDSLLVAAGSGVATMGLPGSAGIPAAVAAQTLVLDYNDADALGEAFALFPQRIAAVITEAAPANMGVVTPAPGFNAEIARLCRENGALFIFDEVLTGFRVCSAGYYGISGAEEGWMPDLFTFGKVIGGGMPVAAVAGKAEVMDQLAPTGPVYQAGTLSGNPVAMAAGFATLSNATASVYEHIDSVSGLVEQGLKDALNAAGVNHSIQRAGNLFSMAFGTAEHGVHNYAQAAAQESWRYGPFFHAMLDAGVFLPPSVFEAWFFSAAHSPAEVERVLNALPAAAEAAAGAVQP